MSLIFFDGFDHYTATADIPKVYTGNSGAGAMTISAAAARTGNGGLRATSTGTGGLSGISLRLPSARTLLYAGFAFRPVALPSAANTINTTICAFNEIGSGTPGIKIVLRSNGSIKICAQSGAKNDNWTGAPLVPGNWYHVEVKAKYVSGTSPGCALGDVEVRIDYGDGNGPVVVNQIAAGQSTAYNGSSGGYTNVNFGDPNSGSGWPASTVCYEVDDYYLCDGEGTANNSYLGDCKVETLFPDGPGSSTQFTPAGGGDNFAKVGEASLNLDTTYVSTSGVGNRDSYALGDLESTPLAIFGVAVRSIVRTDASESGRKCNNALRVDGAYYDALQSGNLGGAWVKVESIWEANPATGEPWARPDVDGLEAGVKLVS